MDEQDSDLWGTLQTHLSRADRRLEGVVEETERVRRLLGRDVPSALAAARQAMEDLEVRWHKLLAGAWAVVDFAALLPESREVVALRRRLLDALAAGGVDAIEPPLGKPPVAEECQLERGGGPPGLVVAVRQLGFRDRVSGRVLRRAVVVVGGDQDESGQTGGS